MIPDPIPLPCALAFPPPIHRDATTPSPWWAPHFMTQERIMFSNPTPSERRLSPAATMSDVTPWALTPPLHCASISQSTTPPEIVTLSVRPSLLQFVSIVSPHSPSLRLGLPVPQPSRRHHAQSLVGPSFHDPRTHHVLESQPDQPRLSPVAKMRDATPLSLTVLALRFHLAGCSPSSSCRF